MAYRSTIRRHGGFPLSREFSIGDRVTICTSRLVGRIEAERRGTRQMEYMVDGRWYRRSLLSFTPTDAELQARIAAVRQWRIEHGLDSEVLR